MFWKHIDRLNITYLSYSIFWLVAFFLLVFWTHFTQVFSQHFTVYFTALYQFISQHFTCLCLSILSVYFTSILLVYSSSFIHLNLNLFLPNIPSVIFSTFHFYFLIFTRLLKLRSFVVSIKISAEMYFKTLHFCSEGTV